MRQVLEQILDLQPLWTHNKTDAMDERGRLVRHSGPEWLRAFAAELASAIGIPNIDIGFEGRDGTGPKTEVPWFRFFSKERSPSATQGWYCVYLFDTSGEVAYLTVGHGSTEWTGSDFRPRPTTELEALATWARSKVAGMAAQRPNLLTAISLNSRRSNLGPSYEAGTAVAIAYHREAIPHPEVLKTDALFMAHLLGEVYRAELLEPLPGSVAPELRELLEVVDRVAGKRVKRGQGFRLSAAQRQEIERRAMAVATQKLVQMGWEEGKDVSARESFDLLCKTGDSTLYVEVKGTVSSGGTVILTRNEVALHREQHPNNCLIVVHGISLEQSGEHAKASGGTPIVVQPWEIEDVALSPVSYTYEVPSPDMAEG